jgi:molecular chaperone HtpG
MVIDNCEELLPSYLSFMTGIVDSEDLPLNVSREILQESKILGVIKKNLVKRCLQMFSKLSEDETKYTTFYKHFAKYLKLGIHEDTTNVSKLAKLLRFYSSKNNSDSQISLDTYISNMKENQEYIYYIIGEGKESLENSPFLEKLTSKGYEVLLMTEPIDEFMMIKLNEYKGKKFVSITKEGLEIDNTDDEKIQFQHDKESVKDLLDLIKEVLSEYLEKVEVSNRLSKTPCCLVTTQFNLGPNMERILKAQAMANNLLFDIPNKKIMEINPSHPIIKSLSNKVRTEKDSENVKDLIWLLYDTTLLSSGFTHENPVQFSNRILRLISLGLDVNEVVEQSVKHDTIQEVVVPEPEPVQESLHEVVVLEPVQEVVVPEPEPEPVHEVVVPEPVQEVVVPEPEPVHEVVVPEPEPVQEVVVPKPLEEVVA